ncbi:MAG: hypothetical protein ABIN36_04545 [Ferruginibacter sp.]
MMKKNLIKWILPAVLLFTACNKDNDVAPVVITPVPVDTISKGGAYILSEGGFGANNSKLAYRVDSSGVIFGDYFLEKNPALTGGLGDLANDMIVYGNKIYIVMNGSGNITVLNLATGVQITTIPVPSGPRFATGYNGKVYASAYDGTVKVIDTATLAISNSIVVGPNPEALVAVGNYLYVTNSGGLNPVPDSTISVVDLNTQLETQKITVGINPQKIEANSLGDLYVSSYGNFTSIPATVTVVSSATKSVKATLNSDYSYSQVRIHNDTAYFYNNYGGAGTCKMYNTIADTTIRSEFITDGTVITSPYGINIDDKGNVYIADAGDFTSSGSVTCFDRNGVKKFSFSVAPGVNPNKIVFVK